MMQKKEGAIGSKGTTGGGGGMVEDDGVKMTGIHVYT